MCNCEHKTKRYLVVTFTHHGDLCWIISTVASIILIIIHTIPCGESTIEWMKLVFLCMYIHLHVRVFPPWNLVIFPCWNLVWSVYLDLTLSSFYILKNPLVVRGMHHKSYSKWKSHFALVQFTKYMISMGNEVVQYLMPQALRIMCAIGGLPIKYIYIYCIEHRVTVLSPFVLLVSTSRIPVNYSQVFLRIVLLVLE